ncbi:hypothetical protein [Waddlia chondrophila]|uniref:Uncharacterized protein n=1 Tax=Waddlia chondrophila (strain ATCC VR-1470 / WSU 86-1044) TaxID=716544 RepID=D6YRU4_WADCW|nr:hypothetical protein [Waddlia chondrophila]ADI38789.1 hypothetical protein wcw_1440 [Waddlia chondrophila WSU 86-1044]
MKIASYFCPFSHKFQAREDFFQLTRWEKLKTITVTALAALATLPLLGLGGIAVFRAMVRHYAPINLRKPSDSDSPQESSASKVDTIVQPVFGKELKSERYLQARKQLVQCNKELETLAKPPLGVEGMLETIKNIEKDIHAFMHEASSMKNESDLALMQEMGDRLVEVSKAIEEKLELESDESELNQALEIIEALIEELPKKEEVESTKTFWERLGGAFGQSQEVKDLAWKVIKYETQVLELKKHIEKAFPFVLQDKDLVSSRLFVGNHRDAVQRLYDILCEVEIDTTDDSRFSQDYLGQVRSLINEQFIPVLRKELKSDSENSSLHQIAEIMFTHVSLEKQCFDTLALFNQMGADALGQLPEEVDDTVHGEHPFVKWINTIYHRISAVPYSAKAPLFNQWANSARGQWNRNFDPYRQGNPTHHFWSLRVGKKEVKMLGMGTPTNEDSWSQAHMNEEFIALMKRYKTVGKKHLFINNQNLIPKTGWTASLINGDETARCKLILDKQDDEDVKGAYFAIALSKNSTFYEQKGEWKERDLAETFKGNVFEQVCKGKRHITGSYIPETIRELIPEFDEKARNVIEQIHEKVFEGKENLSVEERRWFIELFYDNLVKMIIVEGDFDSVNGSCKDQIDRGAGTNAQLAANCYIVSQKDGKLTSEQQGHVLMLMMVRALLVRKRPPLTERVERFVEGMEMSFKHVEQLKALHKTLFLKTPFVPLRVGGE